MCAGRGIGCVGVSLRRLSYRPRLLWSSGTRGGRHAGKENDGARAPREASGKVGGRAGRRVRSGGNSPRARGKTRGALREASGGHWALEGSPRWREVACAFGETHFGRDEAQGGAGPREGRTRNEEGVASSFRRDRARAREGRTLGGVTACVEHARAQGGEAAHRKRALGIGKEGRAHQRSRRTQGCRT